jgi:hypothetical protein
VQDFRPLTEREQQLLAHLLSTEFPGREEIQNQLLNAQVRTIDENGSLEIRGTGTQSAPVVNRVPVEAEGKDTDGVPVYALLHVVDGNVAELELYKADGSPIRSWPNDDMDLFAPPNDTW